jgi:hypothetical protein
MKPSTTPAAMKKTALLATALLALVPLALAAPSEINYQGVLTDQNGNPVNGVRAMQIKIYDAPTGGTLLYSEDLGNVPVQDGVYSFAFGANGTSNALTTETVAIANGTVSTFQKVLAASTVVAGSVTVTDGTYTWDQTNGSSNENDFSVAYSPNLRRVTVTYYNGAPAAGKTISATYRSPNAGITGSLADIGNAWSEVSFGGNPQSPRQKVLAVPLALHALNADSNRLAKEVKRITLPISRFYINDQNFASYSGQAVFPLNQGSVSFHGFTSGKARWYIPWYVKHIHSISVKFKTLSGTGDYGPTTGSVNLGIPGSGWQGASLLNKPDFGWATVPVGVSTKFGEEWYLDFNTQPIWRAGGWAGGGGAEISEMYIVVDVLSIVCAD